jgi:hypothetical protein
MNNSKPSVGDLVKCINRSGYADDLNSTDVYTVTDVGHSLLSNKWYVQVNNGDYWIEFRQFKLVSGFASFFD